MSATHFSGPVVSSAGFQSGTGTVITKMLKGTASVVVPNAAAAAEADISVTITGVAVGDSVTMNPPDASAETGLGVVLVWVSAADTVKVRITNLNASAALVGSTSNWTYLVVRS